MRKYMKGYRKIFFYLFDIALFNSFNKINNRKKKTYTEHRIEIVETLLKIVLLPINKKDIYQTENCKRNIISSNI